MGTKKSNLPPHFLLCRKLHLKLQSDLSHHSDPESGKGKKNKPHFNTIIKLLHKDFQKHWNYIQHGTQTFLCTMHLWLAGCVLLFNFLPEKITRSSIDSLYVAGYTTPTHSAVFFLKITSLTK